MIITVDNIQNAVEESLIKENLPKIAKAYILYRKEKDDLRKKELELNQDKIKTHTLQVTKTS